MITQTLKAQPGAPTGFLHLKTAVGGNVLEIGEFLTIGRDSTNILPIEDEFASNRHARIEQKPNGFLLRDLRSRNGSYVNGARVIEVILREGDRLRFGFTELTFSHTRELKEERCLTSKNERWARQLSRLPSIARSDLPVLLTGPSGTGKEVIATEVHRLSSRSEGPFVSVNCSALSEALVESELFGHLKGSFTGAASDRKGAFEAARGGTLFLDEVGDLPLALQPKLLRALENKQIRPVGGDRNIDTDVRIIAATHHRLKQKVAEGSFRADLYFRLYVAEVNTPPLVDRIEDFEDLLYLFGKQFRVGFSFAAIQRMKEHSWPGNIRELKNVVARAKAYYPDQQIEPDDLNALIDFVVPVTPSVALANRPSRSLIREIEHEMIRTRLIANRGNQRRTAIDLGMPKSTLHDRIRSYGIDVVQLLREAGMN